ncbi:uncharacterized protein LOC111828569 [Capsella rubella]|uniref:uncharacterized protein LOC111828569 n=1 Tax=Capsella rubella TaxID=81985 RepID=UPI000CD59C12|nr:uncharacterized protein LOC111828569 [Capsella rubella]
MNGAIPVAERLMSRGIKTDLRCQICGVEGESINHVLFGCSLARQVWALSDIPSPENGFHPSSLYQNLDYALNIAKNAVGEGNVRRSVPWTLWLLWKNRNSLVFEGMTFMIKEMVRKIREDTDLWFLAQQVEQEEVSGVVAKSTIYKNSWRPPDKPWLKCNIASLWDKEKKRGGAAWVLRNSEGTVLLHSRRSFSFMDSKNDAEICCWRWAIESMRSLKVIRVIFAVEAKDLVDAVSRPHAWPAFKYQSEVILGDLTQIPFWRLLKENRNANKGAFLIAQSVIREDRSQSYVASSYPSWLHEVFTEEMYIT